MAHDLYDEATKRLGGFAQVDAEESFRARVEAEKRRINAQFGWNDDGTKVDQPPRPVRPAMPPQPAPAHDTIRTMLDALWRRRDGTFKLDGDKDPLVIHLTFSLRSPQWPYHYVYFKEERADIEHGLRGLLEKLGQVDRGERKPSVDKRRAPKGVR